MSSVNVVVRFVDQLRDKYGAGPHYNRSSDNLSFSVMQSVPHTVMCDGCLETMEESTSVMIEHRCKQWWNPASPDFAGQQ
jgi:hypothetical protein